jgi:transcriptional antiterminator
MTQKELAEKYGYSENTIYKNFLSVQAGILKKYGILIEKKGRGKKAIFIEKEKPEEQQLKELKEFLETHPAVKEYFEGIEG